MPHVSRSWLHLVLLRLLVTNIDASNFVQRDRTSSKV